ncbi:MAG: ABC transporter permease [Ignavibacteriae bacterium]|nr:ABC transporter permease [Ignavibacteriota bacterium]
MNTLIKMAWRNIWRNKKRTILTMFSIYIAVVLALFTRSMQVGSYGNMISNAVKFSTGYIQIHNKGYWEKKSINETFVESEKIDEILNNDENITFIIPRLESFALASSGKHTKGTLVIGTIPELENELNKYSDKIIKGEYLKANDKAILVAEKLAEYLNVDVGDSLVLLGQGYHGITAAEQYLIKGIIKLPIPQLNNQLVILPLKEAQYYYAADKRLTSISLMLDDAELLDETISKIKNGLDDSYEVMPWQEMNKEMVQTIEVDNIGGIVVLAILYIVIGFGVFGTVMMMTMERRKEFAVMISVGMQKIKLLQVVAWETLFIGIVAILLGIILSYPILLYLYYNPIPLTGEVAKSLEMFGAEPILPFSIKASVFINQILSVIAIVIVAVLYPLSVILKFDVLKAIRS